jgi:hypothetical protein
MSSRYVDKKRRASRSRSKSWGRDNYRHKEKDRRERT